MFSNSRGIQEILSDFLNQSHISGLLLLCNQGCIVNQVQHLMEETFCGSNRHFSTNLDINWVICFSRQSWSLNVYYSYSFYVFLCLAFLYDVDQVLCFSWLTDHDYGLVFGDILGFQIDWIINVDFFKAFKVLEIPYCSHGSVVAWATGDHGEVVTKADLVEFLKVRFELNLSLLSDFILIKSLIRFWRLFKYFGIVFNHNKSSFLLQLFLCVLDFFDRQFPDFVILCFKEAVGIVLESNFLWGDINLVFFWWEGNQNGLLSGGSVNLAHVVLVNQDNAPFWVLV